MKNMHKRSPRLSFTAAAFCVTWNVSVAAAPPAPNTLPANWNVIAGGASLQQNGNTLNIDQSTSRALVNFGSFNVGSDARVDIHQIDSSSALLARVLGSDPSQIYGQIKATGTLWLINPAGILVGQNARIDVGGFIASTLNASNDDFLAGRLTFSGNSASGTVRNFGRIDARDGGSVFLVGANVENGGIINAPNGDVILAAGETVHLLGTGTPGVSVAITGSAGNVTNLGEISAEAGRIGLAAGLVHNSGHLNASSVIKEGGRIFLRATQTLTTAATSNITADGTTGGDVALYAGGTAYLDGAVSARGSADITGSVGNGGHVETSGRHSLDVIHAPTVGRGGEWLIDPYDIEVVGGGAESGTTGTSAITSNGLSAKIKASTIAAQLNGGTDVTLTTGPDGPGETTPQLGNITVSSAIRKTAGADATLTLNASNNIQIGADITSTSGALNLRLNSNYQSDYPSIDHTVQVSNATLNLNGGSLNVSEGAGSNNGMIAVGANAVVALHAVTSQFNASTIDVLSGGLVDVSGGDITIGSAVNNAGTVNVGSGTLKLTQGGTHSGAFTVGSGGTLSLSNGHGFDSGSTFTGAGTVEWSDQILLRTDLTFDSSSPALRVHAVTLNGIGGKTLLTQGRPAIVDGDVTLTGSARWSNDGALSLQGVGATIHTNSEGTRWTNLANGVVTTSSAAEVALGGSGNGNFINDGTLIKSGTAATSYLGLTSHSGGVIRIDSGALALFGGNFDNTFNVASGADLRFSNAQFNGNAAFSGAGTMSWDGYIQFSAPVEIGAGAPTLSIGSDTVVKSLDGDAAHALTTRNTVNAIGGGTFGTAIRNLAWTSYGTVTVGGSAAGSLDVASGASLDNRGTLTLAANSTVSTQGTDYHNAGLITGSGSFDLGGTGTLSNSGTIAPGTSATVGKIAVLGKYSQASTGALNIKIGGTHASAFDLLDVAGAAVLDGTLNLSALGNYEFAVGDVAAFLASPAAGTSGTFSHVKAGSLASFSIGYPTTGAAGARATVTAIPTPPPVTPTPPVPPVETPQEPPTTLPPAPPVPPVVAVPPVTVPLPPVTPPILPPSPPATAALVPVRQATNEVVATVSRITTITTTTPVVVPVIPPVVSSTSTTAMEPQTIGGTPGTFGGEDKPIASPEPAGTAAKPGTKTQTGKLAVCN